MAWGIIDRKEAKREARAILRGAQVSPMGILLLYMGIVWGLHQLRELLGVTGEAPTSRLEDREDGTAGRRPPLPDMQKAPAEEYPSAGAVKKSSAKICRPQEEEISPVFLRRVRGKNN